MVNQQYTVTGGSLFYQYHNIKPAHFQRKRIQLFSEKALLMKQTSLVKYVQKRDSLLSIMMCLPHLHQFFLRLIKPDMGVRVQRDADIRMSHDPL